MATYRTHSPSEWPPRSGPRGALRRAGVRIVTCRLARSELVVVQAGVGSTSAVTPVMAPEATVRTLPRGRA